MARWSALVVALIALGGAWTLSSPVGSSPDDDYHLASIWCSRWAPHETCVPTEPPVFSADRAVLVPEAVNWYTFCFRREPELSGACPLSDDTGLLLRARVNSGEYPGGYYDLMGLLVGPRPTRSALAMRLASWLLATTLVTLAALAAPARLRRAYLAGVVATSVPMALFLMASTNPSGLTFAAVPAAWCAGMAWYDATTTRRRIATAALTMVSLALALGARVDSGLYIAACAGVIVALRRITRRTALVLAAVAVVVVGVALVADYAGRVSAGFGITFDRPLGEVLRRNALNLPLLWSGALGTSKLGWLDTAMPAAVGVGTISVVVLLLAHGLRDTDRRKATALALCLVVLIAYPMYFLAISRSLVGENFQARYLLPLLPVVVAVALLPTPRRTTPLVSRGVLALMGVALSVSHTFALHAQIRRYVTGTDVQGFDLDHRAEWWWPAGPGPMTVWIVGSIAFAVAIFVIGQAWVATPQAAESTNRTEED